MKQLFKRSERKVKANKVEAECYIANIERYLRYKKRYSEKTIFNIIPRIRRIVKVYNVTVPTDQDAIKIEEEQRRLGNSNKTICHFVDALRIMAEYNNVKLDIKKPRLTRKEIDCLNIQECKAMLDATRNKRDKALLAVLLLGALRNTEARFMLCSSVDLKNRILYVRDVGQGIKNRQERKVIMSQECANMVKNWMDERPVVENEFLFVTIYGNQLSIEDVNRIVKRTASRADINKHVTAHRCRHSCASNMLKSGISVSEVALQLGHKSITTTTDVYLHGDYDSLKDQIDKKFIL
jgi:site-specific recombinase XerD